MCNRLAIIVIAFLSLANVYIDKRTNEPNGITESKSCADGDGSLTGSECNHPFDPDLKQKIVETEASFASDIDALRPTSGKVVTLEIPAGHAPSDSPLPNMVSDRQPIIRTGPMLVEQPIGTASPSYFEHPALSQTQLQFESHTSNDAGPFGHAAMQVGNYNLFQYRRMMINHRSPNPQELQGSWRGINKGLATVAIDEQFIKHFHNVNGQIYGDNVSVHQVPLNQVHRNGWRPAIDNSTGALKRQGRFLVQDSRGIGPFRHGLVLNYRQGGNRILDPARLIEDRLVKLDDNHMLGRATVRLGPIRIPLAFFVLEKIPD